MDKTLFALFEIDFSGKGIILIVGGLFLIYKSTKEIYHKTEISNSDSLCFLMMIGVALLAEGLHFEIPKGYIYFQWPLLFL